MKKMCRRRDRRHLRALRAGLSRFAGDRSGNVAIFFGMILVVLMLAVGAAIDIGRWLHARDQTLAAVDAAVLAGARYLQTNSDDMDGALGAAQKFYEQNVKSRLPVTDDTVKFEIASDGQSMTASGTAHIQTPFLQFATIDKLPLINASTAEFSQAGRRIGENLEISVMLDVTGSMAGQKLLDLKAAAKDLVNIIVDAGDKDVTTKIALVPFSEDVRLPTTSALNKARGTGLADCKQLKNGNASTCSGNSGGGGGGWGNASANYYLSPCVVERSGNSKYNDDAPSSGKYVMAHYADESNTTGSGNNKKGKCTIPENSAILPLSDDADDLRSKIDKLSASGGTAGHLGTAWAWYTLSPNWASLWASNSQPVAYDTPNYKKIAILMTDGEYNTEYDKNGVRTGSRGAGSAVNDTSTKQARELCSAMKQKGIIVYTIGFELSGSWSDSYKTLKQCASDDDKFYNTDNGVQLQQAFRDIGLKLSKIYLSK